MNRDQQNARIVVDAATFEANSFRVASPQISGFQGASRSELDRVSQSGRRLQTLNSVAEHPFHVMIEVYTELLGPDGRETEKEQIWYANTEALTNEVFRGVNVLAWTHPGVQLALATKIGKCEGIRANGYRLLSVEPLARARFDAVLPQLSGVYEPGGSVRPMPPRAQQQSGLKAVKLNMTPDQVKAFISRMSGLMIVTGAPGSGKTTVAFQRIRFLFDQQEQRDSFSQLVSYTPALTRVFLANENLADLAKTLLVDQLNVPDSVVQSVGDFIGSYLDHVWVYKHGARPRQRKLSPMETAARAAILGLSDHRDLRGLWETYEHQLADRLGTSVSARWLGSNRDSGPDLKQLATALARAGGKAKAGSDPLHSPLTMGAIFGEVSGVYEAVRGRMSPKARGDFDEQFQHWLFWVYDPLAAIAAYFGNRRSEAAVRMRRGTAARANEAEILDSAILDWNERIYGPEDRPWIAWLLRFALPEATEPHDRFREIPSAILMAMADGRRWTHIVIDEAQDLCASEASLLGSLVDPGGALTVSADFRQTVSPVHGMPNWQAFKTGLALRDRGAVQLFPFARNMRQSRQIGRFLQGFFEVAFKEKPTFEVNTSLDDKKPQLIIAPPHEQALRIRQIAAVLGRSQVVNSIALLQINEDAEALQRLRRDLELAGVVLAPLWAGKGPGLLTTSVERIKGLEFDACIVLGLDDVENAALNFTLNRAYVALSRPARRLVLICSEFPKLLRKVDDSLFDRT